MAYKLSTLFIYLPYAAIYGFIYAFILIALLKLNDLWEYKHLAFLPFGISLFDFIENIGIIAMLHSYPEKLLIISKITSFATQGKWMFAGLTFFLFFSLIITSKTKIFIHYLKEN